MGDGEVKYREPEISMIDRTYVQRGTREVVREISWSASIRMPLGSKYAIQMLSCPTYLELEEAIDRLLAIGGTIILHDHDVDDDDEQVDQARDDRDYRRQSISPSLRYRIFARDGFRCQLCGAMAKDGTTLHIDHKQPVSLGGDNHETNLHTLCATCNIGRGTKPLPDFC